MLSQPNKQHKLPRVWVIIANGGVGQRFGASGAKQYAKVLGKTIFEWTLAQFLQRTDIAGVVIPSNPSDPYVGTQNGVSDSRVTIVNGGENRAQSVLNGLIWLGNHASAADWVLVHDVARPLVQAIDIDNLLAHVFNTDCGAILACPIADTVKRVNEHQIIEETIPRDGLWGAQTPQCFPLETLKAALLAAMDKHLSVTDEASAMEIAGHRVGIVQGQRTNIKVTYAEDLAFVASQLEVSQ